MKVFYIFVLLLSACGKGSDSETVADDFVVNSDESTLQERLTITNEPIELVEPEGTGLGLLPGVETFTAVQVAELAPVVLSGVSLQANDVVVEGTATYISYNTAGDAYGGAIDLLDITQILALKILTNVTSASKDFNGLAKDGQTLYAVGATSAGTAPAFLMKIGLNSNLMTGTTTSYTLPSYAGNDVLVTSGNVVTSSGDTGGVTIFNKATMAQTSYTALADVRSVDVMSDGTIMALSGQTGKASIYSTAGVLSRAMTLGGATIPQAKSTLQVGPKWSLAALGDGGMTVFCNANGTIITNTPQVTVSGLASTKTVTNAASSSSGLIFTANGEAGVYVYSLKDLTTTGTCGTGKVTLLGSLSFGAGFSANAVFLRNGLLFVVSGTGGLKILTATYVSTVTLSSNL